MLYTQHALADMPTPTLLQQHGFRKGIKTVRLDATSDCNTDLVVKVQQTQANVRENAPRKLIAVVSSRASGTPLLLRPRDTLTLYVDEVPVLMAVLGVYPLPELCKRTGVLDKALVLLSVA
jgi:hypothetical protein